MAGGNKANDVLNSPLVKGFFDLNTILNIFLYPYKHIFSNIRNLKDGVDPENSVLRILMILGGLFFCMLFTALPFVPGYAAWVANIIDVVTFEVGILATLSEFYLPLAIPLTPLAYNLLASDVAITAVGAHLAANPVVYIETQLVRVINYFRYGDPEIFLSPKEIKRLLKIYENIDKEWIIDKVMTLRDLIRGKEDPGMAVDLKATFLEARKGNLQALTDILHQIYEHKKAQIQLGKVAEDEAQALENLKSMLYPGTGDTVVHIPSESEMAVLHVSNSQAPDSERSSKLGDETNSADEFSDASSTTSSSGKNHGNGAASSISPGPSSPLSGSTLSSPSIALVLSREESYESILSISRSSCSPKAPRKDAYLSSSGDESNISYRSNDSPTHKSTKTARTRLSHSTSYEARLDAMVDSMFSSDSEKKSKESFADNDGKNTTLPREGKQPILDSSTDSASSARHRKTRQQRRRPGSRHHSSTESSMSPGKTSILHSMRKKKSNATKEELKKRVEKSRDEASSSREYVLSQGDSAHHALLRWKSKLDKNRETQMATRPSLRSHDLEDGEDAVSPLTVPTLEEIDSRLKALSGAQQKASGIKVDQRVLIPRKKTVRQSGSYRPTSPNKMYL